MKTFTELELLKEIGKKVGIAKPLICPFCSDSDGEQPLSNFGDYENELFCPHCDLHLEIKLVGKGVSWRKFIT